MTFPEPILLVTHGVEEFAIDKALFGTLVEPVEAFNTNGLRDFYETVIISWNPDDERAHDLAISKQLIDWVHTEVCPRLRPGRTPIWL